MNLDPKTGAKDSFPPLAPPEWTMEVERTEAGYFVAIVSCAGRPHCRISINKDFETIDEARTALAVKVRLWIAEYLQRDHGGDTKPSDLS